MSSTIEAEETYGAPPTPPETPRPFEVRQILIPYTKSANTPLTGRKRKKDELHVRRPYVRKPYVARPVRKREHEGFTLLPPPGSRANARSTHRNCGGGDGNEGESGPN
jgi:hypothetical protein